MGVHSRKPAPREVGLDYSKIRGQTLFESSTKILLNRA